MSALGQKWTHAVQQKRLLFDHLVSGLLEMHRYVGRLLALEDDRGNRSRGGTDRQNQSHGDQTAINYEEPFEVSSARV